MLELLSELTLFMLLAGLVGKLDEGLVFSLDPKLAFLKKNCLLELLGLVGVSIPSS